MGRTGWGLCGALGLVLAALVLWPPPPRHLSNWGGPAPTAEGLIARARALPTLTPRPGAPEPRPAPSAAAQTQDQAQALDQYLNSLVDARLFHGAALVARNGQVLLRKGYGMADSAAATPNSPSTRFRIASMSKQFTAMAVMRLQAEGRLSTADPICTYLPDCPAAWKPITIRELLSHTSGIPDYTSLADFSATQAVSVTPTELVARFRELPLLFEPGSSYSYGNSGYVLLGQIVERASGSPYADFLREQLFEPLQMADSGVSQGTGDSGAALGYHDFDHLAAPLDTSTLFGAGALSSTVDDLYRWAQAVQSGQLLPAQIQSEMLTPVRNDYAYGWKVAVRDGRRQISHPGLIDGFASAILLAPDDGLTVVVLCNMDSADAPGIASYLATLALQ